MPPIQKNREIDDLFAARMKQVRELRGLSQSRLAKRADVHQSAISKIEAGSRTVGLGEAVAICRVLNVDLLEMSGPGNVIVTRIA